MRLRPIALLLLLALALRLGAGPHPCHAAVEAVAKPAAATQAMPSCHGSHAQAPKAPEKAPKGSDCCDPKGNHSLCEQGCQRAAVLAVGLSAPADRPYQELPPAAAPATAAAVPFAIDHVPLA